LALFLLTLPPDATGRTLRVLGIGSVDMGSDDLSRAMERLSKGLRNSPETSGAIGHALTRGEVRESELIEALRPHLPMRYELAKGEVVDAAGQRSRQQDIIISDALTGTPFLASGGMGVFPVEIVFAVLREMLAMSLIAAGVLMPSPQEGERRDA
jgi:hypothetical protein